MDRNKKRSVLRDYSVALLTMASIIPGAFSNMIFYTISPFFIIAFYAAVFILLAWLYRFIHKKFGDENWSNSIIVTGVILPFVLGSIVSMGLIMDL